MKYEILISSDRYYLSDEVEKFINDGWYVNGGVSAVFDGIQVIYMQSIMCNDY